MEIGTELCRCNRPVAKPHCPKCGSMWVRAVRRNNRLAHPAPGIEKVMKGFTCRVCGQEFQEDWPCAAPYKSLGSKPRRRSELERDVAQMNPKEREMRMEAARKAVAKLLEARGVQATEEKSSVIDTTNDPMFGGKE